MKKRWMSFLLAFTMFLTLAMPTMAATPVTPTAPSWWEGEEYLTFPGDEVYQPENWQKILDMRAQAEAGYIPEIHEDWDYYSSKNPLWYQDNNLSVHMGWHTYGNEKVSPGTKYEIALVMVKYAMNDYEKNGKRNAFSAPYYAFRSTSDTVYKNAAETQADRYHLELWEKRFSVIAGYKEDAWLYDNYTAKGKPLEDFFDSKWMDLVPNDKKERILREVPIYPELKEKADAERAAEMGEKERKRLKLCIDGNEIRATDTIHSMEIKDGRTMVPLRLIAERLGAIVDWDGTTGKVTMTRANQTVVMTLGSKTAYVDGKAMEMDVAPYVKSDRTLLPARYVAEFFGQKVDWDASNNKVSISEDFSVEGDSNLRAWAIPMGTMLHLVRNEEIGYGRPRNKELQYPYFKYKTVAKEAQDTLGAETWGINGREDLIETVLRMTDHGHNETFLERAESSYADAYTKQVYKKYGDKGILAWDLFRMSNLVQWGYNAGYVTYAESLALIQPAAQRLKDNFSSWEEAYENYLYGYCWWSGTGVAGQNIYQTERGKLYTEMMANKEYKAYFDNSLFNKPIIPIPGVSAEDLRKEIM